MFHKQVTKPQSRTARKMPDRQQRIYDFLNATPVGVLSSVTPSGDPHGSVIYFSLDKDFVISFLTKVETRKFDNLKHNNHVMLTVFDNATQTTAQITGISVKVTDSYEINGIAGAILAASMKTGSAGLPPISKLQAGPYTAFRLVPSQIRMAVYARPDPGEYTELFESIESFDLDHNIV